MSDQELASYQEMFVLLDRRLDRAESFEDLVVSCTTVGGELVNVLIGDPDLNTCCNTFGGHSPDCTFSDR